MTTPVLPPYIYQMMDHLYISDARGYTHHAFFNVMINTTYVLKPGKLSVSDIDDHTHHIQIEPDDTGISTLHDLCTEITKATQQFKKILLYGDDYYPSALLVYTYLTTRYHFTAIDISRLIATRPFNPGLTNAFHQLLTKK